VKRASEIFLELAKEGPVPHGREDQVYEERLLALGFERAPGAYVLNPTAPVILAAHLDTVKGTRPRGVRVEEGVARGIGGALGADDKAGVALIMALVARGPREGVGYALFLSEEEGCVGSNEALDAGLFRGAKAMVSLDRKATKDVVIEQRGQPTASEEAGRWLAKELGMGHAPASGVWTDSAVFAGVIPECLNLSVGYEGAHTDQDRQDLVYLDELEEALAALRWEELPVVRTPQKVWKRKGGR